MTLRFDSKGLAVVPLRSKPGDAFVNAAREVQELSA
jgi:hypothetical protein